MRKQSKGNLTLGPQQHYRQPLSEEIQHPDTDTKANHRAFGLGHQDEMADCDLNHVILRTVKQSLVLLRRTSQA